MKKGLPVTRVFSHWDKNRKSTRKIIVDNTAGISAYDRIHNLRNGDYCRVAEVDHKRKVVEIFYEHSCFRAKKNDPFITCSPYYREGTI